MAKTKNLGAKNILTLENNGVYTMKRGVLSGFESTYGDGIPVFVRVVNLTQSEGDSYPVFECEVLDETGYVLESAGVYEYDVDQFSALVLEIPPAQYAIQYMRDEDLVPVECFATRESMEKRLKTLWMDSDVERDSIRILEIKKQLTVTKKGRGVVVQ